MIVKQAAEFEQRLAEVNRRLAREADIDADGQALLRDLADARQDTLESEIQQVDPYLLLALDRGVLGALRALHAVDVSERRRRLRVALEQARHALRDIVAGEPTTESEPAKNVAQWLDAVLDVSQAEVAQLLGVSPRTYQRWVSSTDSAEPHGDDARRVRTLARVVSNLRHALSGPGVVAWFMRPHPAGGGAPVNLLGEPSETQTLMRLASSARSSSAT